jgi:proteic killer suppression protein
MEITYRTKKFKKECEDFSKAKKEYGKQIAEKLFMRIEVLKSAINLQEISMIRSLNLHPLSGNRKEQLAINLTGKFRLILTINNDEVVEFVKVESINLEEIVNYHS